MQQKNGMVVAEATCMGTMMTSVLSETAKDKAREIVGVLSVPAQDIEGLKDRAARATALVDECREILERFKDECLEVELLAQNLIAYPDYETGDRILEDLRRSLESELNATNC